MATAWIKTEAVGTGEAVAKAAAMLRASRCPVIVDMGSDVAGTREAIALAETAGGAFDHIGSDPVLKDLLVLQDDGMMLGAPSEIRRRAGRLLLVGPSVFAIWPDLADYLLEPAADLGAGAGQKEVVWLGAPGDLPALPNKERVTCIDCEGIDLSDALGMIRAALGKRRYGEGPIPPDMAEMAAEWLAAASFGCAVWSAEDLDAIGVEMLSGLVKDLNRETRFTGLPVHRDDQAWGAAQIGAWRCGFPLRAGFGRGYADYDPWQFAAERLVRSGEADLLVLVSALGETPPLPEWAGDIPVIAIAVGETAAQSAAVRFQTGVAGRDHGGAVFERRAAGFRPLEAGAASEAPSAASILAGIAAELGSSAVSGEAA